MRKHEAQPAAGTVGDANGTVADWRSSEFVRAAVQVAILRRQRTGKRKGKRQGRTQEER